MTPEVSVVIPVYNTEKYLRQCLDSLQNQTLQDLEIICVDDGSTDGSLVVLKEYAGRDPRFRIISQMNQGPGAARNAGLDQASGEYLIFLDSDDWFEPDFLESMAARAEATGADVTVCCSDEFDTHSGQVLDGSWMLKLSLLPKSVFRPEEVAENLFQFTYGWPWDKLYRREYVLKEGFRYPDFAISQDLVFVYPSIFCAGSISISNRTFIHHRVNRLASVSNSRSKTPENSYQALKMVEGCLEKRGLMDCYRKSFLNWAMEFLVWHVSNIGDRAVRRQYYRTLRVIWLPEQHFDRYPRNYFTNQVVYAKYRLVKDAPYSVFLAALKLYRTFKRKGAQSKN